MKELLLFATTFGIVFFLGLQSLSVNGKLYTMAMINSLVIGSFNLFLFKTVPSMDGVSEIVAYLVGGPCGIVCAMFVHPKISKWITK